MLIPALLSLFCLTEVLAQSQSPPVVLIVPGVVGDSATADSDILDSVRLHLAAAKKYRVIAFDRENPTIARFIMERGLASELYKKMADPAAREMARRGAGEILLTSMDRDGTQDGYDLELTRAVAEAVNVPVIASGGVGRLEHFYDGIVRGKAEAVLAASVFHFGTFTISQVKSYLREQGVEVRL